MIEEPSAKNNLLRLQQSALAGDLHQIDSVPHLLLTQVYSEPDRHIIQ
jgi:hypothetical protein